MEREGEEGQETLPVNSTALTTINVSTKVDIPFTVELMNTPDNFEGGKIHIGIFKIGRHYHQINGFWIR